MPFGLWLIRLPKFTLFWLEFPYPSAIHKKNSLSGLNPFTDGLGKGGLDLKLQPSVNPPIAHSSSSQQNIFNTLKCARFEQTRQNGEQRSETNRYSFRSPFIAAGNGPSSSSSCKIPYIRFSLLLIRHLYIFFSI